jgi:acyl-CoA synthetase (AMP-forming)/AMP-acid ligase II
MSIPPRSTGPLLAAPPIAVPCLHEFVSRWAAKHPDRIALEHGDRVITYDQLQQRMQAWIWALSHRGVGKGDIVAIIGPSLPEAMIALLACSGMGAVYLGMNPRYKAPEVTQLFASARPSVMIALDDGEYHDAIDVATKLGIQIIRGNSIGEEAAPATATDSSVTLALVFTSGSTGRPKAACLPNAGFVRGALVQSEHWGFDESSSILCNLPINHVGSIGNIVATSIVKGGRVAFQSVFDPFEVPALIEQHQLTHWGAVPAMFQMTVTAHHGALPKEQLSSLRRILWSGGAASPALVDMLGEIAPLCSSYGLTESIGEILFTNTSDSVETLTQSVGRPDPRVPVMAIGADGQPVEAGEVGEIVAQLATPFSGYLNDPGATSASFTEDGWLRTGDLARWNSDLTFSLVGRTNEMFKSGGYNVYPREVEIAMEDFPGVALAAVVEVANDVYGYVGHAFVLGDPETIFPDELRAYLLTRLANYKVPKHFVIARELPLLPIGKIDKVALRAASK